jgi:hypothetical protein
MLVRLVYIATVHDLTLDQINQFVTLAQAGTRELGIGSVAVTSNDYYIHYMEGTRELVNNRYNKLLLLKEHVHCTVLRCVEINKHEFPDFTLTYAGLSGAAKEEISKLGPIDPATITSATAMTLIRRVAAHHRYDEPALYLQH